MCESRGSKGNIIIIIQIECISNKKEGWGVKKMNEIPKGEFICQYVGDMFEKLPLFDSCRII